MVTKLVNQLMDGDIYLGLLTVVARLYKYAFEEYGKALPTWSLPEKGEVISVPYRKLFCSRRKNLEVARKALSQECWSAEACILGPIHGVGDFPKTTFTEKTPIPYHGTNGNGALVVLTPTSTPLLGNALSGMKLAVKEWRDHSKSDAVSCGGRSRREAT